MVGLGRSKIRNATPIEIDGDAATIGGGNGTPHAKPLKDRHFPLAGGALADLEMRGHVLDGTQQLEVKYANPL